MSLTPSPITVGGAFRFLFCVPSAAAASKDREGFDGQYWLVEVAAPYFGPRSTPQMKMLILHVFSAAGRG